MHAASNMIATVFCRPDQFENPNCFMLSTAVKKACFQTTCALCNVSCRRTHMLRSERCELVNQHKCLLLQLFVGRVAMLGFSADLIGEELTGMLLMSHLIRHTCVAGCTHDIRTQRGHCYAGVFVRIDPRHRCVLYKYSACSVNTLLGGLAYCMCNCRRQRTFGTAWCPTWAASEQGDCWSSFILVDWLFCSCCSWGWQPWTADRQ